MWQEPKKGKIEWKTMHARYVAMREWDPPVLAKKRKNHSNVLYMCVCSPYSGGVQGVGWHWHEQPQFFFFRRMRVWSKVKVIGSSRCVQKLLTGESVT